MKYIILESQLDKVVNAFDSFINSQSYYGVCRVMVDYDEQIDKFVLNVFFDKKHILSLNSGSKQTKFIRDVINEIGSNFYSFTTLKPLMYEHFDTCS